MNANYIGSVYATRAVITDMKRHNTGRIVFISSQAGQVGVFGYTAYSASKFALRGFAEALQMEVRNNLLTWLSLILSHSLQLIEMLKEKKILK